MDSSVTLSSTVMTLAQDAAEQGFRSILFVRGVVRQGDHRPDRKALANTSALQDIWLELEPLVAEYDWLWEWRNIARYAHTDAPPIEDPPISPDMLRRAQACARSLVQLAQRIVERA
jgi:hypothetical protein